MGPDEGRTGCREAHVHCQVALVLFFVIFLTDSELKSSSQIKTYSCLAWQKSDVFSFVEGL